MRGRKKDPNSYHQRAKKLGIEPSTLRFREDADARQRHQEICLIYYYKNRDKLLKKMKQWAKNNPEWFIKYYKRKLKEKKSTTN
jgi:hypothetical protein